MTESANPYIKQYLMAAGPTPLPPAVSQVMAEPILYHRAPAFIEIYARALERLRPVFGTENQVLSFAASGSGAMESAVANLVGPGEAVVVAPAPSPSEMTASRVPTSSVSPSWTRISLSVPAAGAGTSESTLSVETSNSGSSASTWSPTLFSQRVIVPSVTVSPSCGI